MWTLENHGRYNRDHLRYPSDVTEEEWAQVAPLIPTARRGGRKRTVNIREVFNGLLYVLSTGCQWRAIPKDLPPSGMLLPPLAGISRVDAANAVERNREKLMKVPGVQSIQLIDDGVLVSSTDPTQLPPHVEGVPVIPQIVPLGGE